MNGVLSAFIACVVVCAQAFSVKGSPLDYPKKNQQEDASYEAGSVQEKDFFPHDNHDAIINELDRSSWGVDPDYALGITKRSFNYLDHNYVWS